MKEFKHKVAVITGGAGGIGRAMAERFASEKMKIALADVEEEALMKAEKEMRDQGANVLGVLTDVSKAEEIEALARKTINAFGAVHILCNNAGVFGDFAPSWRQTLEAWEWALGVNLWGVIHGIRTFVPIMLDQDVECHVVNTSSVAGLFSMPLVSVYHATKSPVINLSESLHHELSLQGAKVKVSVLCPGMVRTKIMESERNRPAKLRTDDRKHSEIEQVWFDAYREFVAGGLMPAEVADQVFNAIRDEKFYVFPNPRALEIVRVRVENILEQRNPTLNLPDAMKRRLHI